MITLDPNDKRPQFVVTVGRFTAILPACLCATYPDECVNQGADYFPGTTPRQWCRKMAEQFEAVIINGPLPTPGPEPLTGRNLRARRAPKSDPSPEKIRKLSEKGLTHDHA